MGLCDGSQEILARFSCGFDSRQVHHYNLKENYGTYFIIGVAVGTFIPGPQQELVRTVFNAVWVWIKGLVSKAELK